MAIRIPTLVLLIVATAVLVSHASASAVKEIWIYSYFRFSMLAVIAAAIVYLLVSLWWRRLLMWNGVALSTIVAGFIAAELGLRTFPDSVPDDLIVLFPESVRTRIALDRGMFSSDALKGDGMVYSYVPGWKSPREPWLEIDADGYRNPRRPPAPVDVVLLGDSVMIAQSARKDIAAHLRDRGISAVNYGFGGYGIYQYRDVYRTLVLGRNLPHRWVVVMITAQNDIANSLHYLKVRAAGGDWRDYLGRPTSLGWSAWAESGFVPWSVSAALKVPFLLRQRAIATTATIPVKLPRGEVAAPLATFWFPGVDHGSPERRVLEESIGELIADAVKARARVVLAMAPNSGLIYGPYAPAESAKIREIERNRAEFMVVLQALASGAGATVVDLTDPLRERAGHELVTHQELDYHLNDRGVAIVAAILEKIVGK
jgi:hypothetical protein